MAGGIFGGLENTLGTPLGWDAATPQASNTNVIAQTQSKITETDVTIGTEDTTSTKTTTQTDTTTAGAGVQEWFVRGAIVILGLIFVAVGLGMFEKE